LNSRQVTEDGKPVQGNEVHHQSPILEENQPENIEVHIDRAPHLKGIVEVIFHKLGFLHLLDKREGIL